MSELGLSFKWKNKDRRQIQDIQIAYGVGYSQRLCQNRENPRRSNLTATLRGPKKCTVRFHLSPTCVAPGPIDTLLLKII